MLSNYDRWLATPPEVDEEEPDDDSDRRHDERREREMEDRNR